jgi:hypothetical protein
MLTFPCSVLVTRAYQVAYKNPLVAKTGDILAIGKRDDEWPGWVWCTHPNGVSAWTPEAWLEIDGEKAILLRDYTSAELSVQPGDVLTLLAEESGWYWAVNADHQEGWVPAGCVDDQ